MDYITEAQKNCQLNESDISDGTKWCPPAWDGLLCWPMTPGGELVSLACPEYYREFDPQKRATRRCLEDGRWYWSDESNATWTNYTECFSKKAPYVFPTPSTLISLGVMFDLDHVCWKAGFSCGVYEMIGK
ncbi:hypothetical protein LSTR_LSTR012606 [Laodelphax striatellus]|uniref:G-protein coupled receptors family 2 profile 1 domain-containing protein n=1 Tax=Laodelphax striatellus TaxID=195883 RepID=A0A482XHM1_LAOST|nr:hypothetical protein LSTR_LSTR012606 [Laodelphax striatellus]